MDYYSVKEIMALCSLELHARNNDDDSVITRCILDGVQLVHCCPALLKYVHHYLINFPALNTNKL